MGTLTDALVINDTYSGDLGHVGVTSHEAQLQCLFLSRNGIQVHDKDMASEGEKSLYHELTLAQIAEVRLITRGGSYINPPPPAPADVAYWYRRRESLTT